MNDTLLESFWLRLVLENKLDHDKLIKMMSEFNTDLMNYQAEQPYIERTSQAHKGTYVTWPKMRQESKKLLKKHNLSVVQHPHPAPDNPGMITYLKHSNGYMERYESSIPTNVPPMKHMQDFGAMNTYAKRYTYTATLGIADPSEGDVDEPKKDKMNSESADAPQCPKCNGKMSLRYSEITKQDFWGCALYPKCNGVRQKN